MAAAPAHSSGGRRRTPAEAISEATPGATRELPGSDGAFTQIA
jgi:hypothetical protein